MSEHNMQRRKRPLDEMLKFEVINNPVTMSSWRVQVVSRTNVRSEWMLDGELVVAHERLHTVLDNFRRCFYLFSPSNLKRNSFVKIDNLVYLINSYDYDTKTLTLESINGNFIKVDIIELTEKIDKHIVEFFDNNSIVIISESMKTFTIAFGKSFIKYDSNRKFFNLPVEFDDPNEPFILEIDKGDIETISDIEEVIEELTISEIHRLDLGELKL
jgi:hypothetical protein